MKTASLLLTVKSSMEYVILTELFDFIFHVFDSFLYYYQLIVLRVWFCFSLGIQKIAISAINK